LSHRWRRRTLAAFITGAALATAGWSLVHADGKGAVARGPGGNSALSFYTESNGPTRSAFDPGASAASEAASEHKHKKTDAIAGLTSSRSVCVRLCDGFFFPVAPVSASGDLAGPEAACQNTCPDAPTALYIEPSGSDKIEDAVSTNGAPYTALPVALRSRKTLDNTCSCHRSSPRGYSIALLHDFTLRKGDAVMTPRGFMVFQGQKRLPFARRDFVSLKQAPVQGDNRMALLAMERASAANPPARGAGAGFPAAHSEN
jgi:hypothetical protein